jgi:hypothetical protein
MSGLRRDDWDRSMFKASLSGFAAQAWQTSAKQELLRTADDGLDLAGQAEALRLDQSMVLC